MLSWECLAPTRRLVGEKGATAPGCDSPGSGKPRPVGAKEGIQGCPPPPPLWGGTGALTYVEPFQVTGTQAITGLGLPRRGSEAIYEEAGGTQGLGSLQCHGQEVNALTGQAGNREHRSNSGQVCPHQGDRNQKLLEVVLGVPWAGHGSQRDFPGVCPCEQQNTLEGSPEVTGLLGWKASQQPSPPDRLFWSVAHCRHVHLGRRQEKLQRGFC